MRSRVCLCVGGKKIVTGGIKEMKRVRMRNISKIDGTKISITGLGREANESIKKGEQLDELGRDYLGDKAKLEARYKAIENDVEEKDLEPIDITKI